MSAEDEAREEYFASEDAALERVEHELVDDLHVDPLKAAQAVQDVKMKLGVVRGEGFSIVPDPEHHFRVVPDQKEEIDRHAA